MSYFWIAAEKGHALAAYHLGVANLEPAAGDWASQQDAKKWLRRAASEGIEEAWTKLEKLKESALQN